MICVHIAAAAMIGSYIGARFTGRVRLNTLILVMGVVLLAVGALLRLATGDIAPQLAAPLALLVAGGAYTVVARLTGVAEAGLVLDPILRRLRR